MTYTSKLRNDFVRIYYLDVIEKNHIIVLSKYQWYDVPAYTEKIK